VLTDYGYTVAAALRTLSAPSAAIEKVVALQEKGVTARLQTAPQVWNDCLGRVSGTPDDFLRDMVSLIEIRNRLVHPDGRLNCWYAFQLDPMRAQGWHFSERLRSYVDRRVSYKIPQSNIGYELCLAHFCVDTVLLTIDYIHSVVYPNEPHALWLNLPRTDDGALDLEAAVEAEHLLQLPG